MALTIRLPADVERRLRVQNPDLDAEVSATLLVGLYRRGRISSAELAQALGLARLELDAVLQRHHVTEDLPEREDYAAASARLRALDSP